MSPIPGARLGPYEIVGLNDYLGLMACLACPEASPSLPVAACASACLAAFDFDFDGDIDFADAAHRGLARTFVAQA